MRLSRLALIVAALAVVALLPMPTFAQGTPSGTISGQVTDPDGLPLPGVVVTVESPALQGKRSAVSSAHGDYIIPFLPAGDYKVSFELSGFGSVKQNVRVANAASVPLDARLALATLSETVEVTGTTTGDFGQQAQVATSFKHDLMEKLPTNRTLLSAVNLSPAVHSTGPSGNVTINGALSYENVFMINGVVAQDNIRNTPFNLFIEDAIQETTVTTAAVSAEYGRFAGGVVNAVTKSGGNEFSGSFRTTFDNDKWVALTPYPNDSRLDKIIPTYEATIGGPILRDKLWFFGAGRFNNQTVSRSTSTTNIPFDVGDDEKRYEGKLTYSLSPKHTFKGAYTKIPRTQSNNSFGTIMDLASLYTRKIPQDLLSLNYTGVISPKFFVEANFARRKFTFINSGSQFTDLIRGTLLLDRARGNLRYHSPTFCGVCDPEKRDNKNYVVKANYFLSTGSLGSHNLVAGVDVFDDQRFANNHQSGSDYRIFGTTTQIVGNDIFPVFNNDRSTFIRWTPIFVGSEGNNFWTYSGFLNDAWRLSNKLSFNVGVRFDKNDGKDSVGHSVVKDSAISPRLSVTFDPKGDGAWTFNAAYGTYVTAIANSVGDNASPGGQPATIDFDYLGPAINTGTGPYISQDDAVKAVFDWFNANGGTNRATRGAPSIPGVTSTIASTLSSPHVNETTLGLTRRLGSRGLLRVDGVYRKFKDFYSTRVDLSTGKVSDPKTGRTFDLQVTENTNDVQRDYKAVNAQLSYRFGDRLGVGANYTLSESKGNFNGENAGSGPLTSGIKFYPEYFDPAWSAPVGDLAIDQRHRARAWATYDLPVPASVGSINVGLLEQVASGMPYGAAGSVDSRPYVTNPGYLTPPSTVTYFFTARDAFRTKADIRTDLAVNYAHKIGLGKRTELFGRFTVQNAFNRQEIVDANNISTSVLTRSNTTTLQAFNPFTGTPVEGVNWRKADNFGKPLSRFAYGTPRTYQFSVGFRF